MVSRASFALCFVALLILTACSTSRYSMKHDAAPEGKFDFSQVPDAVPKWEAKSRQGNKSPYRVNGKTYTILGAAEGYVEEGISSWYGLKFHGELTSNGEIYNMYEMSAAHKSLPLPSYLKVTNLENGKEVVVRVNDRGPFHSDRIIDLSFAAANRLGFANKGIARVRLEAITPPVPGSVGLVETKAVKGSSPDAAQQKTTVVKDRLAPFVQVAAFSNKAAAESMKEKVAGHAPAQRVFVASSNIEGRPVYRVRIGPFKDEAQALKVRQDIERADIGEPIVITRSVLAQDQ